MTELRNSIQLARDDLAEALRTVEGLRVYDQLGEQVDPPAALVSLPRLTFDGPEPGVPMRATFIVPVFAAHEGDVSDSLAEWVLKVAPVIDETDNAVIVNAEPGTWPAGGKIELPAYLIEVEVALPWR